MADLIFVVDGGAEVRRSAQSCLEQAGFIVRTFSTAADCKQALRLRPSLMLIGVSLPDGDGVELRRQVRSSPLLGGTAVVLLTDGSSEEQSGALEAGTDNCLAKPFSSRELLIRVQAASRHRNPVHPFLVESADFVIDHDAMRLSVRGSEVVTTTLEFRLVDYLAKHRGHAFTRDVLLDAVWGDSHFVNPRSVDACIRRVREKIEPDIARPTYLKTVRGIGYRFDGLAVWPGLGDSCNCFVCAPPDARAAQTGASNRRAAS